MKLQIEKAEPVRGGIRITAFMPLTQLETSELKKAFSVVYD